MNFDVRSEIIKNEELLNELKIQLEKAIQNEVNEKIEHLNKDRQSFQDVYNLKFRPGTALSTQTFMSGKEGEKCSDKNKSS